MRLRLFRAFALFVSGAILVVKSPAAAADDAKPAPIKIAIVGDSTVATYKPESPMRGWGQLLPEFLDPAKVQVENDAAPGRSTKTFKSEGRWDKVLASGAKYVFIQFGHNDSHPKEKPEAVDAKVDFPNSLREYVDTARAHNMIPILVTPMHRGQWKSDKVHLTEELLPYADAVRQVGIEKKVPVVDLYALTGADFERMGDEQIQTLFYSPTTDRTHFGEKGARYLAGLVVQEADRLLPGFEAETGKKAEK